MGSRDIETGDDQIFRYADRLLVAISPDVINGNIIEGHPYLRTARALENSVNLGGYSFCLTGLMQFNQ